jgi:hypothetical protein
MSTLLCLPKHRKFLVPRNDRCHANGPS